MMPIRILALIEATTVTGPAKNLIRFCRLVNAGPDAGLTISIACFERRGKDKSAPSSNPFLDAVRAAGVELDVIPERGRFDRSVIRALSGIIDRRQANIIQTHAPKSHFLIRYTGLHRRLKWIAFQHGNTAEDFKMLMYIRMGRWALHAAHRVVTVCGPFAEALVRTGIARERIDILPNSIEPAAPPSNGEILALRERLGISDNVRTILSIGRFSTEKGQADLLAAMNLLGRDAARRPLKLILVGDGIDGPRLKQTVASNGLTDQVIFAGHQRNVWPFYGLADVLVLPSHSEGSPNVLLEAMTAGVPIVATAVGGVPETVENESSALLTPARQPVQLASAIGRVLDDPILARKLTDNASARVRECFSPRSHYEALLRIYHRVGI
jgi:glycosyltransferase involved in cell wall biosynthesis